MQKLTVTKLLFGFQTRSLKVAEQPKNTLLKSIFRLLD